MSSKKNSQPTPTRPPLAPFDVELSPAGQEALRKNIEALNVQLEAGNRGYFDVPTGHANAIKSAFEGAACSHQGASELGQSPEARRGWHVTIVSVNPTFAKISFHADGDPEPPPGEPALALLAQVRAEVGKLLGSIPVPRPQ